MQFDLRGAEQAREGMHNSLVNGRPVRRRRDSQKEQRLIASPQIDVHFSLPKAEEVSGECTREKNQASERAEDKGRV